MSRYPLAVILAAMLWCPWVGWAQASAPVAEDPQVATPPIASHSSDSVALLDLLGKLTLAVLLAWGLAWAARWVQQHGVGRPGGRVQCEGEGDLQLEETLSLGADGRLYLVRVAGQRILLAGREGQLSRIQLSDAQEPVATFYHAVRERSAAPADEVNIAHTRVATRPVRSDVVSDPVSWAQRRDQLLRQLQDS